VPFDADNFMGILTQHMYKAPVPILALVPAPEIPPSLDAIIQKCLTKKVEGRYLSMAELLADLEKLERVEVPLALAEMMARSGGFNVPADYFRISGMPQPVPATPARSSKPKRLSFFVAMGVVGTLGLAALASTLFKPGASKADGPPITSVPEPVVTVPAAGSVASAQVAGPATPAAPTVQHVGLVVDPKDARVVREGSSENLNVAMGKVAIGIDVVGGAPVALEVTAPGRKPAQVTVDGSISTLIVRLDTAAAPAGPAKPKAAKAAPGGRKCEPGFDLNCDPFK
jgi:hypothetical protein